jgi:hypothetical protein
MRATRAISPWTWSAIVSRSAPVIGASFPFLPGLVIAGSAVPLAFPESLAHRLAHRFSLVIIELAVAVLIELFDHLLVPSHTCRFTLVVVELSVTVFVVLFEHFFMQLTFSRTVALVAVSRAFFCHCWHGPQAGDDD